MQTKTELLHYALPRTEKEPGPPVRVQSTVSGRLITRGPIPSIDDLCCDTIANTVARNYDTSQDMDFWNIASVLSVSRLL